MTKNDEVENGTLDKVSPSEREAKKENRIFQGEEDYYFMT